ncbi:hypothetical protein ACXZ1K_13580 [Pedobacter sp. PWIIR3]
MSPGLMNLVSLEKKTPVATMKKSDKPTPYILVKAYTTSEWDTCDFAIVHITEEWKTDMAKRVKLLEPLTEINDFFNVSFWDAPEGFFLYPPKSKVASFLPREEDWCYIVTDENEIERLTIPENRLDGEQLILLHKNAAYYKGYGKHTSEEFCTAELNVTDIINGA